MKKKNAEIPIIFYAIMDVVTAMMAWSVFYFFRKWLLSRSLSAENNSPIDYKFWLEMAFIPLGWLILYAIVGTYRSLYKKSRLFELTTTFICSLIGCVVLFCVIILDDTKSNYAYYYFAFFGLLGIHFTFTFLGRLVFLNIAKRQLLNGAV